MPLLESEQERKAVVLSENLGYITIKISPMSNRGWPDRVFINRWGFHVYIEFKRLGKKLRRLQEYRISQLQERGVKVYGPCDYTMAADTLKLYANHNPGEDNA